MRHAFTVWKALALLLAAVLPAMAAGDATMAAGHTAPAAVHADTLLGRLVFDAATKQYAGRARWAGVEVAVMLQGDDADTLAAALETAHALWDFDAEWDARARRVAADQLLPTYDAQWRGDGPALDTEAFAARLAPDIVVALSDGEFELWFRDDGLFAGHSIRVVGSLLDGPQAAYLEG